MEKKLGAMEDRYTEFLIPPIRSSKKKYRKSGRESIFEEIMAENFQEVMKGMSLEIVYRSIVFQIVLSKHMHTSQ